MNKIKKGDVVYNIMSGNNTLFRVEKIIKLHNKEKIAILKGLTERIQIDSNIKNLNPVKKDIIKKHMEIIDKKIENKVYNVNKNKSPLIK